MPSEKLNKAQQTFLFLLSLIIVGFGQPAWSWVASLLAASIGYAFFFRILLSEDSPKRRFWKAAVWFGCVQLIQLSWMLSHPYSYIYLVWILGAFLLGLQFGLVGIFIYPPQLTRIRRLFAISALWSLLEWARLFVLSGFSFNPIGIALTAHIYSLQFASIGGVYFLSFWVMLLNLFALRVWTTSFQLKPLLAWSAALALPFTFGALHYHWHQKELSQSQEGAFSALLIQTAFPVEESMSIWNTQNMIDYVVDEWKQILQISRKEVGKPIDLVALPEFAVPYGTYSYVYRLETVQRIFKEILGDKSLSSLPRLEEPYAKQVETHQGSLWFVNNAFWMQGLANVFNAEVIAGLEDAEDLVGKKRRHFSSAQYFIPQSVDGALCRYDKRVLVPMGEYIPFEICRKLAAAYGIQGSFVAGKEAHVFPHSKAPFGVSICYEETFGHLMRESRHKGAELLVNLTSDVWFPKVCQQHYDLARLRTVENGVPLLRACNTGVTCGLDSTGKVVAILGENDPNQEWLSDSLLVQVPRYHYKTLYSWLGDHLIVGIAGLLAALSFRFKDYEI